MKRPDLKNITHAYLKGKDGIKRDKRVLYAWFVFGVICAVSASFYVAFPVTVGGAILSIFMGVTTRIDIMRLEHRCGVLHKIMDGGVLVSILDGVEDTYLICCGEIFVFKRNGGKERHVFDFETMTYCRGEGSLLEFTV